MIELVKISENISRSFNGKETVETLQAVNYRIVEITELWKTVWKKAMSLSGKAVLT